MIQQRIPDFDEDVEQEEIGDVEEVVFVHALDDEGDVVGHGRCRQTLAEDCKSERRIQHPGGEI